MAAISEQSLNRVLFVLLSAALVAFTVISVLRVVYSYNHPTLKITKQQLKYLESPGVILCPATFEQQYIELGTGIEGCGVLRVGRKNELCEAGYLRYHFHQIVLNNMTCVAVKPGYKLYDTRDVVRIRYGYIYFPNATSVYNSIYFGLYTSEKDIHQAEINLGTGAGINVIGVSTITEKKLGGSSHTTFQVTTTSSVPVLESAWEHDNVTGVRGTYGETYIYTPSLLREVREEVWSFQPFDVVSAVGGVFSIVSYIHEKLAGPGPYSPYGFIHSLCYKHVFRRGAG